MNILTNRFGPAHPYKLKRDFKHFIGQAYDGE